MNELTPFEMAVPAIIVGNSLDDGPPPLGLGEPFALVGGDLLGPDGISFRIMHEHQPAFLRWVRESCDTCLVAERPWFRGRPALLAGASGSGRAHAARWLARIVGAPFVILNLTDPVIAANMGASQRVNEALWALPITIAMAAARCANPVVLVVGADQASGDVLSGLASMIDPEAGSSWREDQLGTLVDLGEVTWLLQCEQASKVPVFLKTLATHVAFDQPPTGLDTVFALSVMLEAMGDLGVEPADPLYGWDRIKAQLSGYRHYTGKGLYAAMIGVLTSIGRGATSDTEFDPF